MSAFSNIPPQAVLPLGAYDKSELERAALRADQILLRSDCAAAGNKAAVLSQIGKDLALPKHYGQNLDALYDYMTRTLLSANLKNSDALYGEVEKLLGDLRGAWREIGPKVRSKEAAVPA